MQGLRIVVLASLAATVVALLPVDPAAAQAPAGERRCIEEINNGTRKMLLTESQALVSCKRTFLRGKLAITIAACASPTFSTKIAGAVGKVLANAAKRCGQPPTFGPQSTVEHPLLALAAGVDLMGDLFGPDVESALRPESLVKTCQENVLKATQRCADVRMKEFNLCKRTGMKSGAIVDSATLQQQCGGTTAQPDPKGKITRACDDKLSAAVEGSCVAVGVGLAQAFPACGEASGAGLLTCLGARARCQTCDLLNDVDDLAKDCDVFDDGDDGNQSCDEPTTCGDLLVDGQENCEDGNALAGDGCSDVCQREDGWSCDGALPSNCTEVCADGLLVGNEACDDGGSAAGDGCDATCHVESGYSCSGQPSVCGPVCGDGQVLAGEVCDDGNTAPGDGCSATCAIEPGYGCSGAPSVCERFMVSITSPAHGSFTTATTVTVTGTIDLDPAIAALTVNGASVPVAPGGTFSVVVPLDQAAIFNPIEATLMDVVHGGVAHDRIVVHYGQSVADGAFSGQTVGLRLNDSGLDKVEPLVADLAGGDLDLADLVPVGTTLINNQCFVSIFGGCIGRATVKIANPPPSFQTFALAADSMTNFVAGDITVNNIRVDVFLDGSGVVPDCPITLTANQAFFFGDYTLSPDPVDAETIDVVQQGALDVAFAGFQTSFGGICDAPIIGDIIQAFIPDVEELTINAMRDFLSDPDGAGPLDSPTADAIETALSGVSISGPIGEGLGVNFQTPLFAVNEDNVGITLGSNSRITASTGSGPGQCLPPPGAPNLGASLAFTEPFPTYGINTPTLGVPYDVAVSISAEGFNQLLKAQTECGLLVTSINEIDLGFGPLPLTAGLLTALMPQFAVFSPATPFRIDIRPTLAPIVTGAAGPAGELTELRVANVVAFVVADDGSEEVALTAAFDAQLGMNAEFVPGALGIVLSPPAAGAVQIAIIDNPLGVNEVTLETNILPPLVSSLIPDLASSLSSFPLPDFLGLSLHGLEVGRVGQFVSLYTNLTPAAP